MTEQIPNIEYSRLAYPTDRLTIRDLRNLYPREFTQEEPYFLSQDQNSGARGDLAMTLWLERALAHKAYAAALGQPDPHPDEEWSRSEMIRMLADTYKDYGLSSGAAHTRQLVRDIENQALAQAKEHQDQKGR